MSFALGCCCWNQCLVLLGELGVLAVRGLNCLFVKGFFKRTRDLPKVTIDGKTYDAPEGANVLEVCHAFGGQDGAFLLSPLPEGGR
jgi:hypothetical protein